jgi:hypothetical protein
MRWTFRALNKILMRLRPGNTSETQRITAQKFTNTQQLIQFRGADTSLARPTSWCILFDGENILFDASLVTYISSTDILPGMVINRTYEN